VVDGIQSCAQFLSKNKNSKCKKAAVADACPGICEKECQPRDPCENDDTAAAVKIKDGVQSCEAFLDVKRGKKCKMMDVANACPTFCTPECFPRGKCENNDLDPAVREVNGVQTCEAFLSTKTNQRCNKDAIANACPSICNPECLIEQCLNDSSKITGDCSDIDKSKCNKVKFLNACPGVCNKRCACEDSTGKVRVFGVNYGKCKDFTKEECKTKVEKGSLEITLGDRCPATCDRCIEL
jgi:hypothetical protein